MSCDIYVTVAQCVVDCDLLQSNATRTSSLPHCLTTKLPHNCLSTSSYPARSTTDDPPASFLLVYLPLVCKSTAMKSTRRLHKATHVQCLPLLGPLGIYPLVEAHADAIPLLHRAVKSCFESSMGSKRLCDAAPSAALGPQLDWLEPSDVIWVEEHQPHHRPSFMNPDRVACQVGGTETT